MIRESLFQKKAAFWLEGHFDRPCDQRENGLGGHFDRPSDQRENGLGGHFDRPSDRWGKFSDRTKETGSETGWLVTEPVGVIMLFTRCLQ